MCLVCWKTPQKSTCALCNEKGHTGNYKDCEVYKLKEHESKKLQQYNAYSRNLTTFTCL